MTEIAKGASNTVSAKVDANFNSLKILLKNDIFLDPKENREKIIELLRGQINKDGCIDMTIIDKEGKSFSVKDKDRNLSDEEYFQKSHQRAEVRHRSVLQTGRTGKNHHLRLSVYQ
ncbi:MAG TPA: hypothetical protein PKV51_03890 [Bacillota bacterium]|nr:hypothetical protein [Bacillota bacterium]